MDWRFRTAGGSVSHPIPTSGLILVGVLLVALLWHLSAHEALANPGIAGDGDADWCSNQQEIGLTAGAGGLRDPKNPWDFFNPSHGRGNTVEDILIVAQQFGKNAGNPLYTTDTDRTGLLGQSAWNLGPPDGLQSVADILASVKQFGHHCEVPYAHSWKITNPDANLLSNLGSTDGRFDECGAPPEATSCDDFPPRCTDSLVVLDFGQPDYQSGTYGANYFDYVHNFPFVSNLAISQLAASYAHNWYLATSSCPRLHLVVGVNNSYLIPACVTNPKCGGSPSGAGTALADATRAVQDYLESPNCSQPISSSGCAWQITAWAGDDMEQPSDAELIENPPGRWDCAERTSQFVDSYNSRMDLYETFIPGSGRYLLDYGTAWVPSPTTNLPPSPNLPNGLAAGACWDGDEVYDVAYGATWDYPLPEIYTGPATDSWRSIRESHFMNFFGVMTICLEADPLPRLRCTVPTDFFAPSGAEKDLWQDLKDHSVRQDKFSFATNFKEQ